MVRPRPGATRTMVRAAVLSHYFDVARQLNFNPQALLRRAGFSRSLLGHVDHPLPSDAVVALLESSARDADCATWGLRMAEARQLSDVGAISLLLAHQRTLRDVLHSITQYRHILNESLALYVEDAGRSTILREEVVTDAVQPSRQATELAVAVLFLMCRSLLGQRWRPHSVSFTHPAPPDLQVHRRVFQCKLMFDSDFNGIVCPAELLDLPNPLADPVLARYAQGFIDTLPGTQPASVIQEVRRSIYLLLPMGRASIEQVAQGMGLNVRSLQRRLDEQGQSFSELINGVRRELALHYIENRAYALGRISEQLGYAKPSSFTRWFTSQFGVAPAQWRNEHV